MELLSLWGLKLGTPEPAPAEQQKACDRAATKSPPPSSSGAENAWYMQPSSCGASLLILRAVRGWYSHYHSHFTDDKTEAQSCWTPNPGLLYSIPTVLSQGWSPAFSPLVFFTTLLPGVLPPLYLHFFTSALIPKSPLTVMKSHQY